jgi:ABC-type Fe3+-siderophore transport system permease subunit
MMIKYKSIGNPGGTLLFSIVNLAGYFAYMAWFYAVGFKGMEKLKANGFELIELQFFNFILIVNIAIDLYFVFTFNRSNGFNFGSIIVRIPEPESVYLIGLAITLYLKMLTSKLITSIEKNRITHIEDYYKTLLLLLIPYIGILFVHYRVREKLN